MQNGMAALFLMTKSRGVVCNALQEDEVAESFGRHKAELGDVAKQAPSLFRPNYLLCMWGNGSRIKHRLFLASFPLEESLVRYPWLSPNFVCILEQ